MERRWNVLLIIPVLAALLAFFLTENIIYTALGFVVGYLILQGLRFLLLPSGLHSAVRAFQSGRLEEALARTNQIIEDKPDRWEPYYLRALIHFALSNLPAAEADAREAVERKPDSDTNYVTLGQVLYAQTRFSEAEKAFAEAARLRGTEGLNQFHLGATLFHLERYQDAIPRLELAANLGTSNEQMELLARYYLARSLQQEGHEEEAADVYSDMQEHADALDDLKRDLDSASDYPARHLLQKDIAAIEKRLRVT
ncbi:MAG: tetratricopeptide repeat protein [Candidatus Promineifilaceae bacterium]|nr:tetratricopeptide repeat protein [Candidatus Promineifilaceae bacterium]